MDTTRWKPSHNRRVRVIVGVDGRTWVLRRRIHWHGAGERSEYEYEHEVRSGGTWFNMGTLIAYWGVVAWLGMSAHIPWYFWIVALIGAGLLGLRWYMWRVWELTAECAEPAERWWGCARGRGGARAELRAVERSIRTTGSPHRRDGLLEQVDGDTRILRWPTPPEATPKITDNIR